MLDNDSAVFDDDAAWAALAEQYETENINKNKQSPPKNQSQNAASFFMDSPDEAWLELVEPKIDSQPQILFTLDASKNPTISSYQPPSQEGVPISKYMANSPIPSNSLDLNRRLHQFFGFQGFRGGQEEVIIEALSGHDVGVFWSTGSGKSLCYLLPGLITGKVTIVISPLVSLMQDQVRTFNMTVGQGKKELAVLLGVGQDDRDKEARAFKGDFKIVYMTPEKLPHVESQMVSLHRTIGIGLLAVDEAHCSSQWGHDFRPSYRDIGKNFRDIEELKAIPIMALTATATPKIRTDIISVLRMNSNCKVFSNTVDRPNLRLSVLPLKKGFEANLLTLTTAFKQGRRDSTIIYTSTTKDVDSIVEYLQQELDDSSLCMGYHGKLSQDQRRIAHTSFLTGKCLVIVATIAFGMGIDKADIRRVINYGSPQSIEQYYQMIGRAGRDGYDAECVLIHSETDLNQLCGEFYIKDKSQEQKQAYLSSIERMRSFANSSECRRAEIVKFFQEPQTFSSCSNCDNCLIRANQSAKSRDYTEECHLILTSVEVCSRSSLGAGKVLAKICDHVKKDTDKKFEGLSQKPIKTYIKPLFEGLIQKLQGMQYIAVEIKSFAKNEGGFSPTYSCYSLTFKGRAFLDSKSTISLPVPTLVQLEEERIEKERNQQIQELQKQGLDTGFIGKTTDLEAVNDEIKVRLHWVNALKGYRDKGMSQIVAAKEEFLCRILQWRQERAQELQLAPEAVFKESIAYRIAYTSSSSVSALEAIGIRVSGIDELSSLLSKSLLELGLLSATAPPSSSSASATDSDQLLQPPQGIIYINPCKKKIIATAGKKISEKSPSWKISYDQFKGGAPIQAIAMNHARSILPQTVMGHLFDAFLYGEGVDFSRIATDAKSFHVTLPTKSVCDMLESACLSCGVNSCEVALAEDFYSARRRILEKVPLLAGIISIPNPELSPQDQSLKNLWLSTYCPWYFTLKAADVRLDFSSATAPTPTPSLSVLGGNNAEGPDAPGKTCSALQEEQDVKRPRVSYMH